jgi:hypothetical protein
MHGCSGADRGHNQLKFWYYLSNVGPGMAPISFWPTQWTDEGPVVHAVPPRLLPLSAKHAPQPEPAHPPTPHPPCGAVQVSGEEESFQGPAGSLSAPARGG